MALVGWERTLRLQALIDAAAHMGIRLQPLRIGESPWQQLRHTPLDGILLERNLTPGMIEQVCRAARLLQRVPVIVAITDGEDEEMRTALNAGADAVLPASAGVQVVAAQLAALLRRRTVASGQGQTQYVLGDLVINIPARKVMAKGREVPLTNLEFAILVALVRNANQVLSSSRIYYEASGFVMLESEARELMKAHIRRIRAKLEACHVSRELIKNVRGEGYMIECPQPLLPRPVVLMDTFSEARSAF